MNEQNFDYLKKQLLYTGFGEELQRELREKMSIGEPSFTLTHKAKFGDDDTEAILHFKKGDEGDMYFFNRYFLQLKNPRLEEPITQSFGVGRSNNITLKEGYNLLDGRSVYKEMSNKEGEKYKAWLQLDFKETNEFGDYKMKQYHENYGFNLRESLAKFPIKELQNVKNAENLVKSLERGNRQSVTLIQGEIEQKIFIEANPQFKSLNIYNNEMLRINLHSQKHLQSKSVSIEHGNSQAGSQGKKPATSKGQSSKNEKRSVSSKQSNDLNENLE